MAKLKLSLPSGSEVEKTVISYFKKNEANYLILDAESVGSMGLPIILVSKIMEDKVIKIADQNEWQQVKSYLKAIISGEKMDYIAAPVSLPADEVYYTQLTLPVASFDVLKSSYVVENVAPVASVAPVTESVEAVNAPVVEEVVPVTEELVGEQPVNMSINVAADEPMMADIAVSVTNQNEPIVNEMIAPVENAVPIANPVENVEVVNNNVDMTTPMMNEGLNSSQSSDVAPSVTEPVVSDPVIAEPVIATAPVEEVQNSVVEPMIANTPVIEETVVPVAEPVGEKEEKIDFSDCKAMFMQACENMFDALAAKIETELKNK